MAERREVGIVVVRSKLLHKQSNVHDIGMRLWMEAGRQVLAKASAVRAQARYLHVSSQCLGLVGTYLLHSIYSGCLCLVCAGTRQARLTDWSMR